MGYEEIYETYKEVAKEHINRDLFNHSTDDAAKTIEDIKNNKIAIYTAFTGDYDTLKEPEVIDENCDYICFTDNPNLKSDIWKIIQMDETTLDNNRKAKQYKLLPHKYLKDYKYSFWLDGTFRIKGSIREYIYKNIKADSPMLCVVHTERDCVYEEYEASKIIPRYPRSVMEEQITYYKNQGFPEKYGLGVMGAIFRKHNDGAVIKVMEDWWEENIKFTNQDQLSFAYVCWANDFHPSVSLIYYWDNEYWAKDKGNYHHKVVFSMPITSDNLRAKIGAQVENMELEDTIELSKEELYLLVNDVKGMAGYRIDTAGRVGYLQNEYNTFLNSNSLKLTKPLRAAGSVARKVKYNPVVKFAKHRHTEEKIHIYETIKKFGIFNEAEYLKLHGGVRNAILHFIGEGSKTDSIDDKLKYIDPIFDLYYYISSHKLSSNEDPVIHYITKGFDEKLAINRNYPPFVAVLHENLHKQLDTFVTKRINEKLANETYITDAKTLIDYIHTTHEFKTDTIKVGVFLEDNFDNMNACPFIRIHSLFKELSGSGDYHFFIYGQEILPLIDVNQIIKSKIFDVIVIQRVNPYSTPIIKKAKQHGIKLVYEADDDFLDINPFNPSFNYIHGNLVNIKKLVGAADKIVVSTPELKKRFDKLNLASDVEIIRNYYLDNVLPLKPFSYTGDSYVKIGYFGTMTHNNDLELIHNVILRLKDIFSKKAIQVDFEVIGASIDENIDWFGVKKLPYYPMSMATFMKWIANEAKWDIGIIPLVNTEFNKCKSELKYIEFTALGVPVVASDVDIYKNTIEDGVTGFLANNEDEWVDKLSILIENPTLRNGMLNNARADILKNYDLRDRAKQWDEIFKSLC